MSELLTLPSGVVLSGVLVGAVAVLMLLGPRRTGAVSSPPGETASSRNTSGGPGLIERRPGLLRRRFRLGSVFGQWFRRRVEVPQQVDPAMLLDLTGALLVSGVGIEAALDRLARCVPGTERLAQVHRALTAGAEWEQAWAGLGAGSLASFGDHLAFAHTTGAPTAELLQVSARQARAERRQEAERRAAQLSVQMVIPLGLCFLPAFVLLGVVPVILGLIPGS